MSLDPKALVRFAPSPTGLLHVGNLRGALVNWLFARQTGADFLLRIDDTDTERSTAEYNAAIERDLMWLGLEWDQSARQSERLGRYSEAESKLVEAGRLYPCYETPEELETKRKLQMARGKPPVYDRAALDLSDEEKSALEAEGCKPHWRFLLEREVVAWEDIVRGPSHIDMASLSDPVLIRSDGRPLYMLPSVVDDMDHGVSHVIRGEDHVTNTAEQVQIFQALGGEVPAFGHFPLLTGAAGESLSKRLGSLSLAAIRDEGYEPLALLSLVAKLGTADPVEPFTSLDALVSSFDITRFSRSAAHFDMEELKHLNAKLLHLLSFEDVAEKLADLGLEGAGKDFWNAVRPNLGVLADAAGWWQVVNGEITPHIDDADFMAAAVGELPDEPWDDTTWGVWTKAVAAATGAKGKALFRPLRLALTGREHGPEMKNLLPLIGPARAVARLSSESV